MSRFVSWESGLQRLQRPDVFPPETPAKERGPKLTTAHARGWKFYARPRNYPTPDDLSLIINTPTLETLARGKFFPEIRLAIPPTSWTTRVPRNPCGSEGVEAKNRRRRRGQVWKTTRAGITKDDEGRSE